MYKRNLKVEGFLEMFKYIKPIKKHPILAGEHAAPTPHQLTTFAAERLGGRTNQHTWAMWPQVWPPKLVPH